MLQIDDEPWSLVTTELRVAHIVHLDGTQTPRIRTQYEIQRTRTGGEVQSQTLPALHMDLEQAREMIVGLQKILELAEGAPPVATTPANSRRH